MSEAADAPRVSVIIPCYNGEGHVAEAIRSALAQTLADIEVVVLNDGSTDGSEAAIRAIDDPRLVYVAKTNSGVADTRNQGVRRSRSDYIAFLDADDVYEPDNLLEKARFLDRHAEVGLVHGDLEYFDESGPIRIESRADCTGDALHAILEFRTSVNGPSSAMARARCLQEVGGFDPHLSTAADMDLWIRLAARTRFGYIPRSLVRYRQHPAQMHLDIDAMEHDLDIIYAKASAAGHFRDRAHFHRCRARAERVLAGSYWHHTQRPSKVARHLLGMAYHRLLGLA